MRVSVLCLWASYGPVSLAQAYDFGVDVVALTKRNVADGPIIVNRLPLATNGSVPYRPEIRQMKDDSYKWNLLMLALSMLQYASQDDALSWYQIAGIHGVPFTSWNDVEPAPGAGLSGYCAHSSVLFPTWHRPYLALYEQELFRLVNIIAGMYPNTTDRQLYKQAASDFRIPYWDWATTAPYGQSHFPDVFWNPTLTQDGPNGIQVIKNPLYSYTFHPLNADAMIWQPLKNWPETKRAPDLNSSTSNPPSRNDMISDILQAKLPEIQQRLFILFANYKDWNSFSNKAWATATNASWLDSIEAIHDIIHIYGGYRGHMTYVPLSAFDPLFFMHHAMTDRLIAIWQALYPEAWMQPMAAGETSFNALEGTIQNSSSPLTPFYHSQNGDFWNSDLARTTEAFGYAYEDVRAPLVPTKDRKKVLARKVARWFGTHSPLSLKSKASTNVYSSTGVLGTSWLSSNRIGGFRPNVKGNAQDPSREAIIQRGRYTEWIANVQIKTDALNGRYNFFFFVGDVPVDTGHWETASNQVGTVGMFAMSRRKGSDSRVSGTLPLTSALMKLVAAGEILDLSPLVVKPFLRNSLCFGILTGNELEIDPSSLDGLSITVTSANVWLSDDEMGLPTFGAAATRLTLWNS